VLLNPTLSPATQSFLRSAYGVLLLLTLLQALPQARRFFLSERWAGYAKAGGWTEALHNPYSLSAVLLAWLGSAILMIRGSHTVGATLLNLVLCRHFFISMRWKGILRGMGAPGFMTYWLGACVFFLEYGSHYDPTGSVRSAALLAFRLDFAVIMLCAGTYKAIAGYPKNDGMELGMINPWWGYWGAFYRPMRPGHWIFRTLNHLAYSTEIVAGLLMLIPSTQFLGAFLIISSFAFIATHIRLSFLCEMVMLCGLLYIPDGHWADRLLASLFPATAPAPLPGPALLTFAFRGLLLGYAALLPFAKAGQYFNFLARRRLPGVLQKALETYTNFFGIIIWRVFSVDVTNFFVNIYQKERDGGKRTLYSRPGDLDWSTGLRYIHVGEFICLASLFTTLKYYPSNSSLFVERLLRYARTIPCPEGSILTFEYVSIRKDASRFFDLPVAEYDVDPARGTVLERVLDSSVSVRAASPVSPVHEGFKPGSYAPLEARHP